MLEERRLSAASGGEDTVHTSDCYCAVQDYITKAVRECPVPGGRVWAEPPGPVPTPGRDLPRKGGRGGHDGEELSCGCDDATMTAESTCKSDNACTECSDFNFGDDCASNQREHCAEIECCPTCETEIRSMFACEHGATCGEGLTCGAPPSPPPADESSTAQHPVLARSVALFAAVLSCIFWR